jgi:hypothetical protein
MAMKLLAFHNQFVSDFPSDDQDDNFIPFDIIQGTQVACPQLELSKRIRAQAFDRFRRLRRLMHQTGLDCRFHISLVACRQGPELAIGILRDRNLEGHGSASIKRLGQSPIGQPRVHW